MRRFLQCAVMASAFVMVAQAQPILTCAPSAVPTLVRQEGITERLGDIVLTCTAGPAAGTVSGNLTIFSSVNITNRVDGINVQGVSVSLEGTGGAPVTLSGTGNLVSSSAIAFNGLAIPVTPFTTLSLRITGLRGNASQTESGQSRPITVALSFNGITLLSTNPQFTVGLASSGLHATVASGTVRFTEGFANAFQGRQRAIAEGADTGTRIIVRFNGFPQNSVVSVPDAIAGSSATDPTSSGALGSPASGGRYTPGTPGGTLLFSRVPDADGSGAGGVPVFTPAGSTTISLSGSNTLTLIDGSGYAVYEVLDENPLLRESAQIGAGLNQNGPCNDGRVTAEVALAPVSTILQAAPSEPIPRFVASTPEPDCGSLQDCGASYFPRLSVDHQAFHFKAASGSAYVFDFLRVRNAGGGALAWTYALNYKNGEGWLVLDPGPAGFKVSALPKDLDPGTYEASLTLDAGPIAGSKTIPIAFTVTEKEPWTGPAPMIRSVVNAANFGQGGLQAGSLATILGDRFTGLFSVTFDGIPADVLFGNEHQINVRVPAGVAGRPSVEVVVASDSRPSAPFKVTVAALSPGIFGVLNQNYELNTREHPAETGSVIQIYLTGAEAPAGGITTVKIHDRDNLAPAFAGPAPGIPGVQQVNVSVPADLPATQSEVLVCVAPGSTAARVCSRPLTLFLSKP